MQIALQGTFYLVASATAATRQIVQTAFISSINISPGDTRTGAALPLRCPGSSARCFSKIACCAGYTNASQNLGSVSVSAVCSQAPQSKLTHAGPAQAIVTAVVPAVAPAAALAQGLSVTESYSYTAISDGYVRPGAGLSSSAAPDFELVHMCRSL